MPTVAVLAFADSFWPHLGLPWGGLEDVLFHPRYFWWKKLDHCTWSRSDGWLVRFLSPKGYAALSPEQLDGLTPGQFLHAERLAARHLRPGDGSEYRTSSTPTRQRITATLRAVDQRKPLSFAEKLAVAADLDGVEATRGLWPEDRARAQLWKLGVVV